jgi:hypothetical protein
MENMQPEAKAVPDTMSALCGVAKQPHSSPLRGLNGALLNFR